MVTKTFEKKSLFGKCSLRTKILEPNSLSETFFVEIWCWRQMENLKVLCTCAWHNYIIQIQICPGADDMEFPANGSYVWEFGCVCLCW